MTRIGAVALLVAALLGACQETTGNQVAETPGGTTREVPPPLENVSDPYAEAAKTKLADQEAGNWDDLHNVYRLGDNIISGSEPHGEEALKRISGMGVKTILSVDGKIPDRKTAAKYGMRYVHVPIHYSGISRSELLKIAKTFRELDGPFYVHCFHGKHRGPAGAAVGRLVLDGVPRKEALAEMRQWCGTAEKYKGLYEVIAAGTIPAAEETAAFEFDFAPAHEVGGFRNAMIESARSWDYLKLLYDNQWAPDPKHPDLDAVNESDKLQQFLGGCTMIDDVKKAPEDFRGWMRVSAEQSKSLHTDLRKLKAGEAEALERANLAFKKIKRSCSDCHAAYRNE